ncbi:transposase [Oricola thermophila]|uniref:Transposase n=1 Tax=Oricola thermophila TaxID=2742145 RepID=A0A6N1VC68_9HYPH|nr:transposase [Oricola thermophila]
MNTDILHRHRREGRAVHKGGQKNQALGRSRGGFPTKIHLKTDFEGHPIAFDVTGGEKADAPHFPVLLALGPDVEPRAVVGDKGYASRANRQAARRCGAIAVIPHKPNEKRKPARFANTIYKARARIEQAVGTFRRLKRMLHAAKKPDGTSRLSSPSPRHSSWSNTSARPRKRRVAYQFLCNNLCNTRCTKMPENRHLFRLFESPASPPY